MTLTSSGIDPLLVAQGDAYSKLTLTQLSSPSIASDVFEYGKQAYRNKSYDEAADSFTSAIEILERDLSIVLTHRAAALEMKRNYKNALEDSLRANPTNSSTVPDPYFTTANILLLQDRLCEAATQLHAGLSVVPNSCFQRPSLVHLYQRVATEMDRRNRWMGNLLPYEILNRILSLLPAKACIRLSITCRYWNKYITQEWPGMWVEVDTTTGTDLPSDGSMVRKVLESIPRARVRSITLNPNCFFRREQTQVVLSTVLRQRWDNVEHLAIHNPHKKSFCDILRLNKTSLKKLMLWDDGTTNGYVHGSSYVKEAAVDAATICTNIQSITTHYPGYRQVYRQITPHLPSSSLVLTRLHLSNSINCADNFHATVSPLQFCANTLTLLNDECPMLQELVLDTLACDGGLTTAYTLPLKRTGLTTLKLSITDPCDGQKDDRVIINQQAQSLIQKNRNTLRSLTLPLFDISILDSCTFLQEISYSGLPALTDFTLSFFNRSLPSGSLDLKSLIAACPALEKVSIHGSQIWDTGVLRELSKVANLRQLDVDMGHCNDITQIADGNDLTDLVMHCRTLHSFSFGYRCHDGYMTESCLNLRAHYCLLADVARCAASNSMIRELNINKVSILMGNELVTILNNVKESRIRKMKIKVHCHIGDKEIHAISSLGNLGLLKIDDRKKEIDTRRLIQIFNQHKGRSGVFVVQVYHENGQGLIGHKQYPVPTTADHFEDHEIKDEKGSLKALYSIKPCYTDFDKVPTRLLSASRFETTDEVVSEWEISDDDRFIIL